ncbi:MAG: c-type cytochrome [Nitrospinota bacterium]|nr:c-type cytochrome [Nitrospinota bacterium]
MTILNGCGQEPEKEPPAPPPEVSVPPVQTPAPRAHPVTQETRDTYQFYCAQCHGTEGHGNGINAPHLTVPPRDHTKADYLETRTDEQLFTAIQQGGLSVGRAPCMPSWGATLNENTIHSLVSYIRELCQCEAL